jgi:ribonuclease HII
MPYQTPDMAEETALHEQGYRFAAGLDEVGRGALAGDVVAAAVVLPADQAVLARLRGVRDSKQMTPRQRALWAKTIQAEAIAVGLGRVSASDIDRLGIAPATRQAMITAIANLSIQPDYLLIDAVRLPSVAIPQKAIIKGDARCLSIAAASVIAKVSRDAAMVELDGVYPGYGFARHKGYGTSLHCSCLRQFGACSIHRRSFAPVRLVLTIEEG